jgi:hypothetical protein
MYLISRQMQCLIQQADFQLLHFFVGRDLVGSLSQFVCYRAQVILCDVFCQLTTEKKIGVLNSRLIQTGRNNLRYL